MKATTMSVEPYSLTELSKIYNVCIRTMKKWMEPFAEEIGTKRGRYYTVVQVKIIFQKLGLPSDMVIE
jgi:hypothetical protein